METLKKLKREYTKTRKNYLELSKNGNQESATIMLQRNEELRQKIKELEPKDTKLSLLQKQKELWNKWLALTAQSRHKEAKETYREYEKIKMLYMQSIRQDVVGFSK